MVVVNKNALLIGLLAGGTACVVSWILTSESSPFYEYFLFNVWLKNKWLALNVLVLLVSIALDVPEGFEYLLIFLQWFLIALAGLAGCKNGSKLNLWLSPSQARTVTERSVLTTLDA